VRVSQFSFAPLLGVVGFVGLVFGFVGCGDGGSDDGSCIPGTYFCVCFNGVCSGGLTCEAGFCLGGDDETSGDGDPGDGDPGDGDPGDGDPGDGDPGDGDPGDGDPGDGDPGDGDPGDGDPGDGDPGDGDGDPGACLFPLTLTPSDVMFVVDGSGSMVNSTWDHDANGNTANVTRWYSLHAALDAALDEYGPLLHAGVKRFPSSTATSMYNTTACTTSAVVEAPMDIDNAASIMAAIPAQAATGVQIKGSSPTTLGIDAAVDQITSQRISNSPAIVLFIDGTPNCNYALPFPNIIEDYDATLVPTIEDAFLGDGIITHVLGIGIVNMLTGANNDGVPYGNPYLILNDVAVAGGAPLAGATKFHDAGTQAELSTGLAAVLDSISCVVDLTRVPEGPPTLAQVPGIVFEQDGAAIPYVASCASGNGWSWALQGEQVRFCGSYCETYKDDPSNIDAGYGCP
jgi:hypothetical protein